MNDATHTSTMHKQCHHRKTTNYRGRHTQYNRRQAYKTNEAPSLDYFVKCQTHTKTVQLFTLCLIPHSRHRALHIPIIGLPGHQRGGADQGNLGPGVAVLHLEVLDHVHLGQALVAAVLGVADEQQLVCLVSGDAV